MRVRIRSWRWGRLSQLRSSAAVRKNAKKREGRSPSPKKKPITQVDDSSEGEEEEEEETVPKPKKKLVRWATSETSLQLTGG